MNEENYTKYSEIDYFKWVKAIAMLVAAVSVASYANTYSKSIEPSSFRSFAVTGEGRIVAIPDIAEFSFTVITEGGADVTVLEKENINKINNAINFIKSKGVESADIKTQNYSVSPRYQYFDCSQRILLELYPPSPKSDVRPCPPPEIVGYTIAQTVLVKIRDREKIGVLLSGVINNGANSVNGPSFNIDDPTKIENEARSEAIKNAREKAEATAKAGGFRLGRILSIVEGGHYPLYYQKYAEAAIANDRGGETPVPTIEPGSQNIVINVSITYEIR